MEQAAKHIVPSLKLKQFRYLAPQKMTAERILTSISHFNPNKEIAYVRREGKWSKWNPDQKIFEQTRTPLRSINFIRRDEPDVGSSGIGGGETGICYSCHGMTSDIPQKLQEIFANPHASTLEQIAS